MTELYLGVDGGSSRTIAVLVDGGGRVLSAGRAGGSNYQAIGERAAARELRAAVEGALRSAGVAAEAVTAAAFGMAGADRSVERAAVEAMVAAEVPIARRFVENGALAVLRAATKDAVGVGLWVGAKTDCVGRDRYGRRHQVGGLGPISGDVGSAEDLAIRAIGAAWMAWDGRSGPSTLTGSVTRALGVDSVEDIPQLLVRGELPEALGAAVVRALFEEARAGDGAAQRLLEDTGSRLGAAAAAVMRALVLRGANAVVVLGGEVFQAEAHEPLAEAVERRIRHTVSEAHVIRLQLEPVIGMVLFARDLVSPTPLGFAGRLRGEDARIRELLAQRIEP